MPRTSPSPPPPPASRDGSPWARVIALGRVQLGPVAARQAEALGVARSTFWDRTVAEGWDRPFRGVAVLPGRELDAATSARAAALAMAGVVTGWSALHLHGATADAPLVPHLVVPTSRRSRRSRRTPGVRVTRSRTLTVADGTLDHGVSVATVPRALLDAAARTSIDRLRAVLIDARQRRLVTIDEVVLRALARPSVPGRGRLLRACAEVDASGADSVLCRQVETRLRGAGFALDARPRTVPGHAVVLHPDITLAGRHVAIEVDGFGSHQDRGHLDVDQRKHNAYVLAGWIVLRIGWQRFVADWGGFVAEVRAALRHGG